MGNTSHSGHTSTEDLRRYFYDQLDRFDSCIGKRDKESSNQTLDMLRPSPQLQNINEIYKDESNSTGLPAGVHRKSSHNVSTDVINEDPEREEAEEKLQDQSLKKIAKEMFNLTYNEVLASKYAAVLGTNEQWNYKLCEEFMKLFDKWPEALVQALRLLCSKLYLIGEASQIDQILEVFAISWCQSHPQNQLGDYKSVHIVCFSLFILNSDLYNNQNQETRFSKDEFVTNTLFAIKEENSAVTDDDTLIETLRAFYDDISQRKLELLNTLPHQKFASRKSSRRLFSNSNTDNAHHNNGNYVNNSNNQRHFSNVSLISKSTNRLSSIGSTVSFSPSLRNISSLTETNDSNYEVDYMKDEYDDELESYGPPWAMEGLIKCEPQQKVRRKKSGLFGWLNNNSRGNISSELDIYNEKDWKQSIVVISKGLLKQYSFGSSSDRKNFIRTKSNEFVSTIITYNLYSAVASLVGENVISNVNSKTNGVAWTLTIPNLLTNDYTGDKKVVYYAPSLQVAHNYIETCNFWAARITSIPTSDKDIVTNQEYGWSPEVLRMDVKSLQRVQISNWECLLSIESSFIPSSLSLTDQSSSMKKYVDSITQSLNDHLVLKEQIEQTWGEKEGIEDRYNTVMNNWSEKYVYLLQQKTKHQTYLDSLALALSFKASKV